MNLQFAHGLFTGLLFILLIVACRRILQLQSKIKKDAARHHGRRERLRETEKTITQFEGIVTRKERSIDNLKEDIEDLKKVITVQDELLRKYTYDMEVVNPVFEPNKAL